MIGEHNGARVIEHAGGAHGFGAQMLHLPDEELTVICLANTPAVNPTAVVQRVLEILVPRHLFLSGADLPTDDAAFEPVAIESCAGQYIDEDESSVVSVSSVDGELTLELMQQRIPLTPTRPRVFRAATGSEVAFDDAGFTLAIGSSVVRYTRLLPLPGPAENDLAGDYLNDELAVTLAIRVHDEELLIGWPDREPAPLFPLAPDLFHATTPLSMTLPVRILRGDGRVVGLRVNAGRAIGVDFHRLEPQKR